MYGSKAKRLFNELKREGIIGAKGEISFDLLNFKVAISDKNAVGSLLQEWLGEWMKIKNIYHRSDDNSQMPPDFYLGKKDSKDWLEIKTFDYDESPNFDVANFDVANFDAYVRDLREKAFRLDSDYLIMGYSLSNGEIKIKGIWLKKIWEITCASNKYALRTQIKQDKIYNIRPYNFKSQSDGFPPFKDRLSFVNSIKETLAKYKGNQSGADEWFNEVLESYTKSTGQSL